VKILKGQKNLSEKDENEELTLGMMSAGPDDRLGCVTRILGDVTVEIPS
jgi:ferredoxin